MQITPIARVYDSPTFARQEAHQTEARERRGAEFALNEDKRQSATSAREATSTASPLAYSPEMLRMTAAQSDAVTLTTGAAIYRNAGQREVGRLTGHQYSATY
ncbi:hypothetical protein [Roseibium polysiphoniae]|uniref:Uncharacterized protein n=1 Tax=Roseibium polysiphoniae TaxID=2571221 RepID=A0ABR9CC07_9HYPH|nr:hypothetical protein [Roseibium polysiphoniae]MBD8877435.1 hypothetical protein [Roseibium polysiphoniae]